MFRSSQQCLGPRRFQPRSEGCKGLGIWHQRHPKATVTQRQWHLSQRNLSNLNLKRVESELFRLFTHLENLLSGIPVQCCQILRQIFVPTDFQGATDVPGLQASAHPHEKAAQGRRLVQHREELRMSQAIDRHNVHPRLRKLGSAVKFLWQLGLKWGKRRWTPSEVSSRGYEVLVVRHLPHTSTRGMLFIPDKVSYVILRMIPGVQN